jgi:hypothetical protein
MLSSENGTPLPVASFRIPAVKEIPLFYWAASDSLPHEMGTLLRAVFSHLGLAIFRALFYH